MIEVGSRKKEEKLRRGRLERRFREGRLRVRLLKASESERD